MKAFLTILILATLLALSSCQLFDNEHELPPITTEGKGTFGCLVNGKVFLPEAPWGYGSGVSAELFKNDTLSSVNIYAGNTNTRQTLFISVLDEPEIMIGKLYDLTDTTKCGFHYVDYSGSFTCDYESLISGHLQFLKFDVTNTTKIIAGTFELTSSSVDCKDMTIVTKGRFDISDVQ
jgi:hypothetical protein